MNQCFTSATAAENGLQDETERRVAVDAEAQYVRTCSGNDLPDESRCH